MYTTASIEIYHSLFIWDFCVFRYRRHRKLLFISTNRSDFKITKPTIYLKFFIRQVYLQGCLSPLYIKYSLTHCVCTQQPHFRMYSFETNSLSDGYGALINKIKNNSTRLINFFLSILYVTKVSIEGTFQKFLEHISKFLKSFSIF